jgi:methylmalonyl-CoA mutase C-terminal domain/subunit
VLGLSILSGAHTTLVPKLMALLRERMEELLVVLGGIIPNLDIPQMKARGVAEVFQPGASMESIVTFIRSHVRQAA